MLRQFLQALVNDVLRDFLNLFVFVYLEDFRNFSSSLEEHKLHIKQVLQRLLENRLCVKAEKCEFHIPSVTFFSYIFESEQLKTNSEKIRTVADWQVPTTRTQLQRFLEFYSTSILGLSETTVR